MKITAKYRIYPTNQQEYVLNTSINVVRQVKNWYLNLRELDNFLYQLREKLNNKKIEDVELFFKQEIFRAINKDNKKGLKINEISMLQLIEKLPEKKYNITQFICDYYQKYNILNKDNLMFFRDSYCDLKGFIKDKRMNKKLQNKLTEEKKNRPWWNIPNAQCLIAAMRDIDKAYDGFFKGGGFPKYKKFERYGSFSNQQNDKPDKKGKYQNRIENLSANGIGWLKLLKFSEGIKIKVHRKIEGKITTVIISKSANGKWFASIVIEDYKEIPVKNKILSKDDVIGIDKGLKDFLIRSDGVKISRTNFINKYKDRLSVLQKRQCKLREKNPNWKTSKRYEKLRKQIASLHQKIVNCRSDIHHKETYALCNKTNFSAFVTEKLNIKGMVKNKNMSKSIHDVAWYEFERQLKYKCEKTGKTHVQVDTFFPSSKLCNKCKYKNKDLKLGQDKWICKNCSSELDRDLNASYNIRDEGYKLILGNK